MARLPLLFRTRSWVPRKNFMAADLGQFGVIFFFTLKMVCCVYSLESPRWGDSNENKENRKETPIMPLDLELWLALIRSNYPCLEYIFMVPKVFEPLKLYCIYRSTYLFQIRAFYNIYWPIYSRFGPSIIYIDPIYSRYGPPRKVTRHSDGLWSMRENANTRNAETTTAKERSHGCS